jgi:hypothetical protein
MEIKPIYMRFKVPVFLPFSRACSGPSHDMACLGDLSALGGSAEHDTRR